jgi:phospholipid/cholesterol/gamma-HCH transport system substrate-binding protein
VADRAGPSLQLRIGAFVLAGLVVFLAIIYLLGAEARYFEPKYKLIAEFTEVGGLIEGATVRLAGVQIGRVTDVKLPSEPGGKVRVTLTIARQFANRVRRDSEARIVTQGLLGDKLVEISIGSAVGPPLQPGEVIATHEPFEPSQVFVEGTRALASIERVARSVEQTLARVNESGAIDDFGATLKSTRRLAQGLDELRERGAIGDLAAAARSARRIGERAEKGPGLVHALIYGEPEILRQLQALLGTAQAVVARAESDRSAVGALLAPGSERGVRALLDAMESVKRITDRAERGDGLLWALLMDPQYKDVARDLQAVAHNFREVSERLTRGEGLLGGLVSPDTTGPLGQTVSDFQAAMTNLRTITDRLSAGEGTLGGLLEDPTVYENLAAFLEGAQRSFLLRALIRSSIGGGSGAGASSDPSAAPRPSRPR